MGGANRKPLPNIEGSPFRSAFRSKEGAGADVLPGVGSFLDVDPYILKCDGLMFYDVRGPAIDALRTNQEGHVQATTSTRCAHG